MVYAGLYTVTGIAIVITIGTFLSHLSDSSDKLPRILLFIVGGLIISEGSLFIPSIQPFINPLKELEFTEFIAELALSIVLFREGLQLNLKSFWDNIKDVLILATIGITITTIIFAGIASIFSKISFLLGLLIAGILAPTDPAATFNMFKGSLRIKSRVKEIIGNESALNDAVAIVLVTTIFVESVRESKLTLSFEILVDFFTSFFGAITLGVILALIFLNLNSYVDNQITTNFLSAGLVILSFALPLYISNYGIKMSAAISSLSAGIVFGNPPMFNYRDFPQIALYKFNENIAEFSQIIAFVAIGMLMQLDRILISMAIGLFFAVIILASRMIAITGIMRRFTDLERDASIFISWAGMRGLATGVLAAISILDLKNSFSILGLDRVVFLNSILFALIFTTIVQTLTMKRIGKETNSVSLVDYSIKLQIERKIILAKLEYYRNKFDNGEISQEEYNSKTIPLRDELDQVINDLKVERQSINRKISTYIDDLRMLNTVKDDVDSYMKENFTGSDPENLPGYDDFKQISNQEEEVIQKLRSQLDRVKIKINSTTTIPNEREKLLDIVENAREDLIELNHQSETTKLDDSIQLCNEILKEDENRSKEDNTVDDEDQEKSQSEG